MAQAAFPSTQLPLGNDYKTLLCFGLLSFFLSYLYYSLDVSISIMFYLVVYLLSCDSVDYSLPGSSVHRISQAEILEWIAISFSRGVFLTQGWNSGLLHWQVGYLPLNYLGS